MACVMKKTKMKKNKKWRFPMHVRTHDRIEVELLSPLQVTTVQGGSESRNRAVFVPALHP